MGFKYLDENLKADMSTASTTLCIYDGEYTVSKKDVHHLLFKSFSLCGKTYRTILMLLIFTVWFTYVYPIIESYTILSTLLTLLLFLIVIFIWIYPLLFMLASCKKASYTGQLMHIMIFDTYISIEEKGVNSNFVFNKDLDIYEDSKYFLFFLNKSIGTLFPKNQINKIKIIELRNLFLSSLGEQFHSL